MSKVVTLFIIGSLMLAAAGAHAATWMVTRATDSYDGVCDSDCSLREAIADATSGDTIIFSALFNTPQTITIIPLHGTLSVIHDLTIDGPGEDLLTVSGGGLVGPVFEFFSTSSIHGITITGSPDAGILNSGILTVTRCIISGNSGTGIVNIAILTVDSSTITENTGASVLNGAGGITNEGDLYISNSTVSYNTDGAQGTHVGGIYSFGDGTLEINNCTISGNYTPGGQSAGGIWINMFGDPPRITNSTVTNNFNGNTNSASGINAACCNNVEIGNTIVAGNVNNTTTPDVAGTFISEGYNLIGNADGAIGFPFLGDVIGTGLSPVDPLLDPLDDYGGPTETHRLQTNSTAIDKGYRFGSTRDQRGFRRPSDNTAVPPATGGDNSDKGAYERLFFTLVFGIVRDPLGNPIPNARVELMADNDRTLVDLTDRLGRFRFTRVPTYRTYDLSVTSRKYEFLPKMVMVKEAPVQVNFMAQP